MPYGRKKSNNGGLRLTGLFRTKKKNLRIGNITGESMEGLIALIKKAKQADKGLTVFVWANPPEDDSKLVGAISVALEQDQEDRPQRRTIKPDPEDTDESGDGADDDPFA